MKKLIHPALVHYPIAFWWASFLMDFVFLFTQDEGWLRFSNIILQAGCIMGSFSVLVGFVEFFRIPQDSPAQKTAVIHIIFSIMGWILFCLNMLVRIAGIFTTNKLILGMVFSAIGLALIAVCNRSGRKLVYTHGIGVDQ